MKMDRCIKLEKLEIDKVKGYVKSLMSFKDDGSRTSAVRKDEQVQGLMDYVTELVQRAFDFGWEEKEKE